MRAGHDGDTATATRLLGDPDAGVRAAALVALARCGRLDLPTWRAAFDDPDATVRRRAGDLAGEATGSGAEGLVPALRRALVDDDPLVVEAACWALGERRAASAVADLSSVVAGHPDARCREAAVAALGAVGDRAGLPAVLTALDDRPAVRRRATVALAAFDGPAVDEALRRSAADRDWQVREVAEILLDAGAAPPPDRDAGPPPD